MVHLIRFHKEDSVWPSDSRPGIGTDTVRSAYENSVSGSKFRLWALDCFFISSTNRRLDKKVEDWTEIARSLEDFAADIATTLAKGHPVTELGDGSKYLDVLEYNYEVKKLGAREALVA